MRPPLSTLLAFERDGHVTTRGILPPARISNVIPDLDAEYELQEVAVYKQKLRVILGQGESELAGADLKDLRRRVAALPEGSLPFLQCFNLWRSVPAIAALASSPELTSMAAALLGTRSVRLFQDSLFVKRAGDLTPHEVPDTQAQSAHVRALPHPSL